MNLIEMIKNEMNGGVVSSLSQKAGVSEDEVKNGLSAGIPAVLAGVLKNATSGGDPSFLGKMLAGGAGSSVENLAGNDQESLLEKGRSLLNGLFGRDTGSVTEAVSSSTGLSSVKSEGLLAMIVPFITGVVSKLMVSKGWSVSDLMTKIFESKGAIVSALPTGLTDSMGLANLHQPHTNSPEVEVPKVLPTHDRPKSGGGLFKWLIVLLVLIAISWWIIHKYVCNGEKVNATLDSTTNVIKAGADTTKAAVKGTLNEAGDFVRDLGARIGKKLPDGTEISVGENSVESQLISFLEDKDKHVDKTTWFSFDRLYFETGKSMLKAESQTQLKNIAAILKAYPNVDLKLGGYTDSTGDAAVNKKISDDRANTAMLALVKLGVPAERLSAEGYGPEHPVAGNDTPEGRAQNRRIDIRVTQK
jgi:OOP family OmpA-OmpF porin